jgi:hypothetical protein
MRVSEEQRSRIEQRIRAAADALLRGDLPPGGKLDITTLARHAGVSRAALYRSYPHLKTAFEQRIRDLATDGPVPDPRQDQITRLKTENAKLRARIARLDATICEHEQFRTLAGSRLAAQHQEISSLRAIAASPAATNVRVLHPRPAKQ